MQESHSPVADAVRPGRLAVASSSMQPWRLLHVEADVIEAMKVKLALRGCLPVDSQIFHVESVAAAVEFLADRDVDAVLAAHAFDDPQDDQPLSELIQTCGTAPVVVLSRDSHTDAVLRAGRLGAREFLPKERVTGDGLAALLKPLIVPADHHDLVARDERRKAGRYTLCVPAVVVPVMPDGSPGPETPGSTVTISRIGIGVLVEQDPQSIPDLCVVGIEGPDGRYRYRTVEWRHRRLAVPAVKLGGRFVTGDEDPLDARHLTPRFDPRRLRYAAAMDAHLLKAWTARGVLRSRTVDRVKSCSACYSLLSYRDGCPECGSFDTERTPLIHHFACAHVAPAAEFGAGDLACPKCRSSRLVVGADFEYLDGPRRCRECSWSDSQLALITECMGCGKRAVADEAVEKDVIAYHVDRLDPLDFVQDAR